ncbi:MAG TPA: chemotaxis protein CheB, partial [Polyangiales bacterium]|nr:chemotaxis protein CheB [Polyangiales bacterium]
MPSKRSSSKPVSKRKPSPKPKKPAQAAKAPPSRAEKPKKDKKPQKERAPAVESKHAFTVVGIGASAGGLEALERFFDVLPASPGAAFVIVTHQSPGHTSLLPELLARRASIPVVAAADGAQLEIDHAYVCPPGHALAIVDRRFELSGRGIQVDPLPIDHFFRTLARDQGSQAVAIVLSGNGTDGTLGIESVKQANGLTMAQDPA